MKKAVVTLATLAVLVSGCSNSIAEPCSVDTPYRCSDYGLSKLDQSKLDPYYRKGN